MHACLHVRQTHAKPSAMLERISAGGRSLRLSQDTAAEESGSGSQRKDGQTPKRLSRLGRPPGIFPSSCDLLARGQCKVLAVEQHQPTFCAWSARSLCILQR